MRDFKKLQVWDKGLELAKRSYALCQKLKDKNHFVLADQIARSSISIPSNIAEGCSRTSEKEYNRFLEISIGSAFELETQLYIAEDFSEKELIGELTNSALEVQRMINGLIQSLKKSRG
jgi:four helix bundle protein